MIAAWCCGKVLAPFTFQGYCDSVVVETWFETFLLPALQPGQVLILDNASFHRKARLSRLVEKVGCRLLALPTYSPDLNKIEHLKLNTCGIRSSIASVSALRKRGTSGTKSITRSVAYKCLPAIQFEGQRRQNQQHHRARRHHLHRRLQSRAA